MNCKTVGFTLALCVVSFAAVAQSTTPQKPGDAPATASSEAREKYRAACASDIQKFCAEHRAGQGCDALVPGCQRAAAFGCLQERAGRAGRGQGRKYDQIANQTIGLPARAGAGKPPAPALSCPSRC